MPDNPPPDQTPTPGRRSSFTQLGLRIGLIAAVFVAALYALTDYVVRIHARDVQEQGINSDMAGLVDIYATSGQDELMARLNDRLELSPVGQDASYYLLSDGAGLPLLGNLTNWPLLSAENSELGLIEGAGGTPVLARATQLAPSLKLIVGRGTAGTRALRSRLAIAFASAGLCITGLAVLLGLHVARQTRTRIDAINQTFNRVGEGTLGERCEVSSKLDEIDDLAGHVNTMLDRLGHLLDSHRSVTDHTAHEIRTPLMHLDTRILSLLKETEETSLVAELGQARNHIRRIVDMLDSLLDIAANEAHIGSYIGLDPLNLSHVVAQVADLFADSAEDMGLDFKVDIESDVMIRGDRMQLSRLVSNLLDNAFKYCGNGGAISLTLTQGPRLTVQDNGPGVPADQREAIFSRFERIHEAPQTERQPGASLVGGHGLGLALARAIAERHGLSLVCAPSDDGAVFVLKRP